MNTSNFPHPIVVGVDGSPSSLQAALWAGDEAARRNLPLRIVHAIALPRLAYGGGLGPPDRFTDALREDGQRWVAAAEAAVHEAHPELRIEIAPKSGNAIPFLIEESRTARLLVLGSRGLGGFTGMLAGSTAVALVAHGHCPVAVIRGRKADEAPPSEGAVVVGVDGSPASESAVSLAFDEASVRGAELVAVHTWVEFASDNVYAYARQFVMDWAVIEAREHEVLAERLAGWQEKYPDVAVRRVVSRDRPVRCLLENAEDAQLLVVGSRGSGGFTGMLQGSTSQALIYHAPCPLIVARPTAT
jgi:nucleotide-binding universal stress UspA family protein